MSRRQIILEKFKRAVRSIRLLYKMNEDRFISQFCQEENELSNIRTTKSNPNLKRFNWNDENVEKDRASNKI